MKSKGRRWQVIPVLFFITLIVFLWRGLSLDPRQLPSAQLGKPLPQLSLPSLDKGEQLLDLSSLSNGVFLLNVWASWCDACVDEQIFMMKLAQKGIPIYGLNYKDNAQDASSWLRQWGNPFKMVLQDTDGKAAIDLGVYGTPETFVIDKHQTIRYRHVGILNQDVWTKKIAPLLHQLELEA